jgi:hypothetical protein
MTPTPHPQWIYPYMSELEWIEFAESKGLHFTDEQKRAAELRQQTKEREQG